MELNKTFFLLEKLTKVLQNICYKCQLLVSNFVLNSVCLVSFFDKKLPQNSSNETSKFA